LIDSVQVGTKKVLGRVLQPTLTTTPTLTPKRCWTLMRLYLMAFSNAALDVRERESLVGNHYGINAILFRKIV
jgi:hypothetical protein